MEIDGVLKGVECLAATRYCFDLKKQVIEDQLFKVF